MVNERGFAGLNVKEATKEAMDDFQEEHDYTQDEAVKALLEEVGYVFGEE